MELNDLKSTWDTLQTQKTSLSEITDMLSENRHPVLKNIKKQFIIELVGWCLFLSCYYTMLDGNEKPIWINILLVLSIIFPLIHNLLWFRLSSYLILGENIRTSLKIYLAKVKTFASISIISRQVYLLGLLYFLTYGLSFDKQKYMLFSLISLIILIQLYITVRMWTLRYKKLQNSLRSFI